MEDFSSFLVCAISLIHTSDVTYYTSDEKTFNLEGHYVTLRGKLQPLRKVARK